MGLKGMNGMRGIGRFINKLSVRIITMIILSVGFLIALSGIFTYRVFSRILLKETYSYLQEVADSTIYNIAQFNFYYLVAFPDDFEEIALMDEEELEARANDLKVQAYMAYSKAVGSLMYQAMSFDLDRIMLLIPLPETGYSEYKALYGQIVDYDNEIADNYILGEVVQTESEEESRIIKRIWTDEIECDFIVDYQEKNSSITLYKAVRNSEEELCGVIIISRSIQEMVDTWTRYLVGNAIAGVSLVLIGTVILGLYIRLRVVKPVIRLAMEADRFTREIVKRERELADDVGNVTEIRFLARSIDKMEEGTMKNIEDLTRMSRESERIDTELSLDNVKMQGNSCVTNGGAINSHGTVSLKNCSIDSNSADNCGGGVYMDSSSTLTVNSSSIIYCQAKGSGGGIYFHSGELILAGGKTMITNCQTNGNTDNINQREFKNIKVTGRLSSGSQIGFKPPANGANRNVTTGYGQKNNAATALYFQCDTNDFKINRDKNDEVYLVEGLKGTFSSYKVSIHIKVTDDADAWDYAYFLIFARDDKGKGLANPIHTTNDFHTAIDDDGEEYTYEYDCGNNYFPSSVDVVTSFGNWGIWRDFEADVTIKINGINVCSNHIVHKVYGDERKNTELKITGDKYPYPDSFDVEVPPGDIENSGTVTVSAVDQYGLTWNSDGGETTMKNISFPEEDTFEKLDKNGSKWKLSSTHKTNHWSTYNLIFKSGSNVYPEIVKPITVKFVFPLHVRVIVNGEEVFETTGMEKETIEIKNIESIPGYYINGYEKTGTGELVKVKDNEYKLTLINESVTLTAKLKANNYKIVYDANGTKGEDGSYTDIIGLMSKKTAYYDKEFTLNPVRFMREGYTFAGWNTKPDGSGQMFKDKGTVLNLTTVRAEEVNLYAIWKPADSSTTASIFSDGTALIYVGAGILILSIVASIIYSKRKKRKDAQTVNQ